jgi:hypothetical protein
MTRSALALLGLLALPAVAAAQATAYGDVPPERLPQSRFSVTPYFGVRVPYTTGDAFLVDTAGNQSRVQWERGGGPMVGLDATAKLAGPVHVLGGVAYSVRRNDVLRYQNLQTGDTATYTAQGPRYWIARAGVQVRLADPNPDARRYHPSAFITAAPAIVWTDWANVPGFPDVANRTTHHFAANVGADAVTRIGRSESWALLLGLQDYVIFWNGGDNAARDAVIGQVVTGTPVTVHYSYSTSNMITLRLGVSYRMP